MAKRATRKKVTSKPVQKESGSGFERFFLRLLILLVFAIIGAVMWGTATVFHESVMRCDPESKLVDCFVPTLVIEKIGKLKP